MNIADLLWNGPRSVDDLATATNTSADHFYRVLRALASLGIFAECAPRTFELTPNALPLCKNSEHCVRDMIHWLADPVHYPIWAEILGAVKTGWPATEIVHGKTAFEVLFATPEVAKSFNDGMTDFCRLLTPAILEAYDFSSIRTLADVAGGHGYLLGAILRKNPAMKGILYDLDSVIEGATQSNAHTDLNDRLQLASGDMFESVPAGADAYFMQHIIHDWDDEKARRILSNCRKALEGVPNGKLILAERVLQEGNPADPIKLVDLEMLVMCGGKERTEPEYRELLESAGFRLNRVISTGAMVDIIEAYPA